MTSPTEAGEPTPPPWHTAYPTPKATAAPISRQDVLEMLRNNGAKDVVLVDLRRNDHEGGTIRGSINLPAQSLWPSIPTLYELFKAAGVRKVIWYCGSSSGRGPRAAGWFADHIAEWGDCDTMESLVLEGGVKGWAGSGGEYVQWIDGYDEAVWVRKLT